jgi:myo-inositol-1(or 4)-monophosphatase
MKPYQAELELACDAADAALKVLADLFPKNVEAEFEDHLPKELKAASDRMLEQVILGKLLPTGLDIYSEEVGEIASGNGGELRWIVDPLDGTVNFIRNLAPCSVSIALCMGNTPIFGVLGEFPSGKLAWGGKGFGALYAGLPIRVSSTTDRSRAVICSGFPSRFLMDTEGVYWVKRVLGPFLKVRMLGAASLSLLHVARGAADVYSENDIMIWDVAAGLAILEGAGGSYTMIKGRNSDALEVYASNGLILED